MILKSLPVLWTAIAPALGNHLWQSTLFAAIAGLLTLLLRKNQARARYWLWMAASVKFLIPFSLLVGIGNQLAWSRGAAVNNAGLYFAMEQFSQPFAQPAAPAIPQYTAATASLSLMHLLPVFLAAAWLCGFALVLAVWCVRWRRIAAAMREAVPLREGREVEALRRLERIAGIGRRIEVFVSRATLEPGIFGITRPVLVWPQAISERLEDAHLEAILAHEVWHARRRDNLAAVIHMVVEAIFWFHPLVWWLGGRLLEERERACDEQVLQMGSERQVYAESILKICEFCVGSPLACVSGVTGADLKKRIVTIMTNNIADKLNFSKKLLLSAAGLLAVALPIVFGLVTPAKSSAAAQGAANAAATKFDSVSITPSKPGEEKNHKLFFLTGKFVATGASLKELIMVAYRPTANDRILGTYREDQIVGAPDWINNEKYDVDAKTNSSTGDTSLMLQTLLADRFKLVAHHEIKDRLVYTLVVAQGGAKLHEAKPGDTYPNAPVIPGVGRVPAGGLWHGPEGITAQAVTIAELAETLSRPLQHTVVDKTGLTGKYDFVLHWTPGDHDFPGTQQNSSTSTNDSARVSVFTAIQEQLGLEVQSQPVQAPDDVLVIDRVEQLTEK